MPTQVVLVVKNPPANARAIKDAGLIPASGNSLEEGMATHSSLLAWEIPRIEEPGRLQFHEVPKSQTLLKQLSTHA